MKALLFIIAVLGFYYGINYYALSEAPVTRWIEKTHFPDSESAENFCKAISPLTKVHFTETENGIKQHVVANSGDSLCSYWKSKTHKNVSHRYTRDNIENLTVTRIQEFPYNQARASFLYTYSWTDPKTRKEIPYIYQENIRFSRNLLGEYRLISFEGNLNTITKK